MAKQAITITPPPNTPERHAARLARMTTVSAIRQMCAQYYAAIGKWPTTASSEADFAKAGVPDMTGASLAAQLMDGKGGLSEDTEWIEMKHLCLRNGMGMRPEQRFLDLCILDPENPQAMSPAALRDLVFNMSVAIW